MNAPDTNLAKCLTRSEVIDALWPDRSARDTSVWAVLDCARDDRIYPWLVNSRLAYRCLYAGKLHPALERVAPHLIELLPGSDFTARLIDAGWGRSWGIFIRIGDPSNLRHHLRGFLRVQDESGRKLLFRYYDPRVLRSYLPTCTVAELNQLFGPIGRYLVEDEYGAGLIEYAFDRTVGTSQATTAAVDKSQSNRHTKIRIFLHPRAV